MLLCSALAAPPAVAEPEVDAPAEDRIGARIDDSAGGDAGAAPGGEAPARRLRRRRALPVRPPTVVVPVLRLVDGRTCLAVVRRPGDPTALGTVVDEAALLRLRRSFGRCPAVRRPVAPLAASAAEPVVRQWAAETALPAPGLRVRPGMAVVGKAAYLEITGEQERRWQVDALGWSITVDATAVYSVDWGDGTVDEGVTSQGGPWPDGDLRHAYLVAGEWVITVTEHWTARWTATGHGQVHTGVLEGVLRTHATLVLPAIDLQAVRRR